MKLRFLPLLFVLLSSFAFAQNSNLVLFSDQGERFFVILNGIRQNSKAETNVKVTDLNQPSYKLKVIFEDKGIPDLDKNVFLEAGTEYVLNIKKNKNGAYVLRFMSQAPIADNAPAPSPQQSVVVYTTTPAPVSTVTTTTTTTTVGTPANNVSVGMNVGGVGINMSVTDNTMMGGTSTTTYTETHSTTVNQPVPVPPPAPLPGYSGPVGCPMPLHPGEFESVKSSIASKTFEDSKLKIAKQVIGSNCLLSSQVKEIMMIFDFENTKLDFAKFAYGHTYDLGNYYKVNDAFQFESTIDDLNRYIQSAR